MLVTHIRKSGVLLFAEQLHTQCNVVLISRHIATQTKNYFIANVFQKFRISLLT